MQFSGCHFFDSAVLFFWRSFVLPTCRRQLVYHFFGASASEDATHLFFRHVLCGRSEKELRNSFPISESMFV